LLVRTICKTTDVFGNVGINSSTIKYVDKAYQRECELEDIEFDILPQSGVCDTTFDGQFSQCGFSSSMPYVHSSVIGDAINIINSSKDTKAYSILAGMTIEHDFDKTLRNAISMPILHNVFNILKSLVSNT
jgi:hypothetical protein